MWTGVLCSGEKRMDTSWMLVDGVERPRDRSGPFLKILLAVVSQCPGSMEKEVQFS